MAFSRIDQDESGGNTVTWRKFGRYIKTYFKGNWVNPVAMTVSQVSLLQRYKGVYTVYVPE